ncbi:DEAD/DEAH box helicase [Sandaracinobacter neustonicus]|uniref:DEAD-box ATP-dependent RNA helicase RhpA n=1 Tax=Sandaracinobacter neustonicus TaxID=1715348 RepID=A0A501XLU1_9SPHN|nr:DEAD/DEAH box helicase [Sandaracinobacter neustonicus]TPE61399.1 DEAD/DEAH box helicase [Sandaracinobacter neustonicus]
MPFSDLHLSDALLKAVADSGYSEPTAIQAAAIPPVLMGKDLIGVAQTGTGKTASFVLPMIDILAEGRSRARMPRSLILEPTRELAAQVAENFEKYGKYHKLSMALLIGGVAFGDQDKALEKGVDVLIATPGRLMDQHARGKILLSGVDVLVIDEADRMLDMGFIPDVEKICTLIKAERQTLLFSATMPPPIKKLADRFMTNPKMVEVARPATTNKDITQSLMPAESRQKRDVLRQLILDDDVKAGIIFCNRKTTVRDLAASLKRHGFKVGQIHGDMEQADRIRELDRFKDGDINLLVASDVAARGLDVKGVSHVFNFDVPWHPDDYVHRIGRTGRAGQKGVAITLITAEDAEAIANIEKLTGQSIPRRAPMARQAAAPDAEERAEAAPRRRDGRRTEAKRQEEAPAREARVEEPRRERRRPESRRDEPRRDSGPREESRRDEPRRQDNRRDEPRRDDSRRDGRDRGDRSRGYQDRDDGPPIGPGFGEEGVPAFLMVSART